MKKHLLLLIVSLFSFGVEAQVKVILLRDTTANQLSPSTLNKKYPSLNELFRTKPQGAFEAIRQRQKQFDTFMKQRNDAPQKGFGMMVYEYYQSNGIANVVLVNPDRPIPDSVLTPMIKRFQEFYENNAYPATGTVAFRTMSMLRYGKTYTPPRIVRKGAGIISTLEAAENTTRPDTVKMLAFNQLNLTSVPDVVYRFPNLEELDLARNQLHELPARLTADIPTLKKLSVLYNAIPDDSVSITRNKHLRSLNLQGNKLTKIPISVRKNRRLESLWMGNNTLTEVDTRTLRRMRRLTDLNLYNAGLTQLPRTIGRLKRIKVLDLYYNKFTTLPDQLGKMKRLEQLALAHNDLSELPASLARLRHLQTLYVHHNRLGRLPATFSKLRKLKLLDLGNNWFSTVPDVIGTLPSLEELSLNNNNLQEFPAVVLSIKKLQKLHMGSNPLFGKEAMKSPYATQIKQLEANKTQVTY